MINGHYAKNFLAPWCKSILLSNVKLGIESFATCEKWCKALSDQLTLTTFITSHNSLIVFCRTKYHVSISFF